MIYTNLAKEEENVLDKWKGAGEGLEVNGKYVRQRVIQKSWKISGYLVVRACTCLCACACVCVCEEWEVEEEWHEPIMTGRQC